MNVYDDIKKAIQDFTLPELREFKALVMERFNTIDERFKRLEDKIDANHREIMNALNLDKRLSIIEDREARKTPSQPKEVQNTPH